MKKKPEEVSWTRPQISIDRQRKIYAVFNEFDLVQDFKQYDIEQLAIIDARGFIALWTEIEPEIIYPRITSMRAW